MTILLIEDDATTRFSVELMLRRANHEVASAEIGEAGLRLACEGDYGLILLDLGLPDIDGIEVLWRLRRAQVATPVLVLTGNDDARMIAAFDEGGDRLPAEAIPCRGADRLHRHDRRADGRAGACAGEGRAAGGEPEDPAPRR